VRILEPVYKNYGTSINAEAYAEIAGNKRIRMNSALAEAFDEASKQKHKKHTTRILNSAFGDQDWRWTAFSPGRRF
jgi:hypothetical protein